MHAPNALLELRLRLLRFRAAGKRNRPAETPATAPGTVDAALAGFVLATFLAMTMLSPVNSTFRSSFFYSRPPIRFPLHGHLRCRGHFARHEIMLERLAEAQKSSPEDRRAEVAIDFHSPRSIPPAGRTNVAKREASLAACQSLRIADLLKGVTPQIPARHVAEMWHKRIDARFHNRSSHRVLYLIPLVHGGVYTIHL